MITLTYPDSKQVHYEYDAADQLITVTDWANRVTRYDYDKNGRLISIVRPNGTQQTRVYDLAGQLLQQKEVVIKTGEVISQVDFSYDAAGNIIEEKTSPEADPNINLEMTYAKANRLASYDDETVQLDADGNLIQGPLSGEMADFVFDSRNRLIQAGETTYHYDAENQRIGVNQTQYVINSQPALSQVLVKTEASGTQTYYVYGLGLIGQEQDGEYLSYHFDYRGSTKALTDKTGQVTERFQYSPYGLLVSGDASTTPFLFNGKYGVMTDDNGLYYMRARFYNPEIRRFVNQDILRGGITDGQTLNRYAYVNGRPVSFVDPFGLDAMDTAESNTASSCITDFANYTALAGGACGAIIGGGGGAIVCSPSGPAALGCGAVGVAEGALIGSSAGFTVGYLLGNIFCYMENGEELTNVPFAARNWTCKAQCNVQQINKTMLCPERVYGTATGSSEESACREAKRDATQSSPRGCYSRHCRCICSH